MFRKVCSVAVVIALVAGLSAVLDPVDAGPLSGKGKGVCKANTAHCKFCPPPEPGCSLVECNKCGCDYTCGDEVVTRMPR